MNRRYFSQENKGNVSKNFEKYASTTFVIFIELKYFTIRVIQNYMLLRSKKLYCQHVFTSSKLTMETIKQVVKYVQS